CYRYLDGEPCDLGTPRRCRIILCCIAEKTDRADGDLSPFFRSNRSFPMSSITYEVAPTVRRGKTVPVAARKSPGLLARLFARFMATRQKQAMHELHRHGLRLPRELEEAGLKISARNEDSLPFVR